MPAPAENEEQVAAPAAAADTSAAAAAAPVAAEGPKTIEEAISAGIESASPKPASKEPAAAAPASETVKPKEGEAPAGGDDKKGEAAAEGAKPAAGAAKEGEGDGKGDDADGQKPKANEQQPEAGKQGEAKEPKEVQPPDHVNDPIPPQVSQRTRERITALVDTVKQQSAIVTQQGELVQHIASTGATPDEFAATIETLRLLHSPDIGDKRKAYQRVMGQATELAKALGEPVPGVDPLEGHRDLAQEVADGKLTQQRAYELAVIRNRDAAAQTLTEQNRRQNAEWSQAQAVARTEMNTLGQVLAGRDPTYALRAPAAFAAIKDSLATLHPSQWKARFLEQYAITPIPAAPAAAAVTTAAIAPAGGPQPLRAIKQPAGGGSTKPAASPLEALELGIEAAANVRR